MSLPRGRTVPLSRGRRLVEDWLYLARGSTLAMVDRDCVIPEVAAARTAALPRPGWFPVLLKAFALACMKLPELRRSLLTFPYARLYEHACTVGAVTVERMVDGEPVVLVCQFREAERKPLLQIHNRFQRAKHDPVETIPDFRRLLLLARLPWPLRRLISCIGTWWSGSLRQRFTGTFASSSTLAGGAALSLPFTPISTLFTFTEVQPTGAVKLRLAWDHRVFDGMTAARGLVETENALRGPILQELLALTRSCRLAV